METLLISAAAGLLCGTVASAVLILFGGYGGHLLVKRDLEELRNGLEHTDERITREVKARAALTPSKKVDQADKDVAALLVAGNENKPPTAVDRQNILKTRRGF